MAQERSVILHGQEIPSLCRVGEFELLLVELNAGQATHVTASSAVRPGRRCCCPVRDRRSSVPCLSVRMSADDERGGGRRGGHALGTEITVADGSRFSVPSRRAGRRDGASRHRRRPGAARRHRRARPALPRLPPPPAVSPTRPEPSPALPRVRHSCHRRRAARSRGVRQDAVHPRHRRRRKPAHALTRAGLQDNATRQTNAGRTGPRRKKKAHESDRPRHLRKADVLKLRDIDKPVQDTYGSAGVQTATGRT